MSVSARSVAMAAGLLLPALLVACSATTRYEVLSFFFDGVPDPSEQYGEAIGPQGNPLRVLSLEERARIQAERLKQRPVFFHRPFEEKKCEECHTFAGARKGGWMQGLPKLLVPKEQLCKRCHEPPEARFVHGPVALGLCALCHEAHRSDYPHLLKAERSRELCTKCHEGETFVTEKEHAEYEDRDCASCHDPHGSDRPSLLREDAPGPGNRPR